MKILPSLIGAAALGLTAVVGSAQAAPFSTEPVDQVKEEVDKKLTEKEKETQARLEAFEKEQAKNKARVVVVQWQESDLDYRNELLQRNIKARTTRSNAMFVPDVDLYQHGRREPDATLRPLDQRARVPASAIDTVNAAVDAVAQINWSALNEQEWGRKAAELRSLSEEIWFVDREELREPLFRLYSQIGRAAENGNIQAPPYFEEVGGVPVNYYYYMAAGMATATPDLMSKLHNSDLIGAVGNYKSQIEQGRFRKLSLNFELSGRFNPREFIQNYKVWIDGVAVEITNERALYEVPAGRSDVYLERADDGHGQSVRVEEVRVDAEEVYSVREQARKRMGIDFYKELMKNKNQCLPEVNDDVLTYVAIYQKLHPGQEIYIAVPEGGSVNRIHLWKWIEEKGQLVKQNDSASAFPVRFVALVGTGLHFGSASFSDPFAADAEFETPPQSVADLQAAADPADFLKIKANGVPITYELRAHWDRLMIGMGMDFTANLQSDGWVEVPVTGTKNHRVYRDSGSSTYSTGTGEENRLLMKESDVSDLTAEEEINTESGLASHPLTMGNQGKGESGFVSRRFQRDVYATVGFVFLREAAAGFGPRIALRGGLVNAPHAVDLTLRGGMAIAAKPKKKRKADSRVQALIDTEIFGGVLVPYGDTIHLLTNVDSEGVLTNGTGNVWGRQAAGANRGIAFQNTTNGEVTDANPPKLRKIGSPIPTFGFVLKAGLTF